MCLVLADMNKHDDLDAVVRRAPEYMYMDSAWWNSQKSCVNLTWLTNQWAIYQCPNHGEEDDEAEVGNSSGE